MHPATLHDARQRSSLCQHVAYASETASSLLSVPPATAAAPKRGCVAQLMSDRARAREQLENKKNKLVALS
jgi:hypothetical protein